MLDTLKKSILNSTLFWLLIIASFAGYYFMLYELPRNQFYPLIGVSCGLFFTYWLLHKFWDENVVVIIGLGVLFRLLVLFAFPNLSDDVFRFICDGRLIINGENPFLHLPTWYLESGNAIAGLNDELYEQLNSPNYFTIYPPILQYIFAFSTWIFPHDIYASALVMKSFIFLAECGSLFLLLKLFKQFEIHSKYIAIYALNPLVIIELTGNLHFEALLIFFLLLSVWWLVKNQISLSAIAMALAICSKLLPLLFLPFLIKRLGLKKSGIYFGIIALLTTLLFTPFLSEALFLNLYESVDLYFQKFEFNASIYYIVRWVGFQVKGWNIIQIAGPVMAAITTIVILVIALRERVVTHKSLFQKMSIALLIYFSMATIIHPWYITTIVAFTAFWRWRFSLIWSFLIPLSYYAYSNPEYAENSWLLAIEYMVIPIFAFYEWRKGWYQEY
ncbi:MAG: mannosyltransferase [Flavobacteriales bacterium]|nr:mannosyltransferase [Flavobacteriales bacterium]